MAIFSEVIHLVLDQLEPKQEPHYQAPFLEKHLVRQMVRVLSTFKCGGVLLCGGDNLGLLGGIDGM